MLFRLMLEPYVVVSLVVGVGIFFVYNRFVVDVVCSTYPIKT